MPAEEIGRRGRRPGSQVNTVYLWSIANFWLLGRKVVARPSIPTRDDPDRAVDGARLLGAGRGGVPGRRHPPGVGHRTTCRPYDEEHVAALLLGGAVAGRRRATLAHQALNADARRLSVPDVLRHAGRHAETPGPTRSRPRRPRAARPRLLPARPERLLVERRRGATCPTRTSPPRSCSTMSTFTHHRLRHLDTDAGGLPRPARRVRRCTRPTRRDRSLQPVPLDELDAIMAAVRNAQSAHYRASPRWIGTRRSAAAPTSTSRSSARSHEAAGIGDEIDWTVPRDIPQPLYDLVSMLEGDNTASSMDDGTAYYEQIP